MTRHRRSQSSTTCIAWWIRYDQLLSGTEECFNKLITLDVAQDVCVNFPKGLLSVVRVWMENLHRPERFCWVSDSEIPVDGCDSIGMNRSKEFKCYEMIKHIYSRKSDLKKEIQRIQLMKTTKTTSQPVPIYRRWCLDDERNKTLEIWPVSEYKIQNITCNVSFY